LSTAEEWHIGKSFTLFDCTTRNAIGLMLTPAPLPPPNGNLYCTCSSSSFLEYSFIVSPLNSLPPAAKPNDTLDIGIIMQLLFVSIGSPYYCIYINHILNTIHSCNHKSLYWMFAHF